MWQLESWNSVHKSVIVLKRSTNRKELVDYTKKSYHDMINHEPNKKYYFGVEFFEQLPANYVKSVLENIPKTLLKFRFQNQAGEIVLYVYQIKWVKPLDLNKEK